MPPLFQITIVPRNSKAQLVLFYSKEETADIARKRIHEAQKGSLPAQILTVDDDYGATAYIDKEDICYMIFLDGAKQQELQKYMMTQPGQRQSSLIPGA